MRRHAVILAAALAWLIIGIDYAEARLDILVDKATQRMLVIQDGYIRYMWPVSTGRDELATPDGVYTPQRMERNWSSAEYYNSPMPYAIFFHNGYAIHGSYAINQLGGPASHGCVRLHPHHAALLFDLVQHEGPENTTIEVTDDARPEQAQLAGREAGLAGREIAPALAGRDIAAGPGLYPPAPRMVRYRETSEPPEPPPLPRANRSIVRLPPRPAPSGRRMISEAKPVANVARAPCGEGDAANESDCRAKSKVAEGAPPEKEQAPSIYGFKLLPASCWSGSASRWRWWGSSQSTSCK